jgi:hypothetical protein
MTEGEQRRKEKMSLRGNLHQMKMRKTMKVIELEGWGDVLAARREKMS